MKVRGRGLRGISVGPAKIDPDFLKVRPRREGSPSGIILSNWWMGFGGAPSEEVRDFLSI